MKKKNLRRFRRVLALCCAAALLLSFAGCQQIGELVSGVAANTGEFPVEVAGVTVSARPQKAVVLSSSLADVVLALGCETQLVAGSEDCTQDGLRSLTKIDGNDANAVLGLAPDLVLADSFSDGLAAALENANIPAVPIAPATDREDFERLYGQVSAAFSGGGAGQETGVRVAQNIFTTLDDINRVVPKEKVVTACYLYDLDGSAVTGDMFGSTIMSYAGVTNVFKSLSGGTYDFDSLRISNPTVIFCVPGLAEGIRADERFADFQAVRNDMIFEMDPVFMERQGRTVIEAAFEISAKSFPELLEETSMTVTDPIEDIESQVSSAMAEPESSSEEPEQYNTLQEGDQNDEVYRMQVRLSELGYLDTDFDGYFGSYTAGSVREFQQVNGLEETGVADADTLRLLYSEKARAAGGE